MMKNTDRARIQAEEARNEMNAAIERYATAMQALALAIDTEYRNSATKSGAP
jgi:hypothetical protein